MPRQSTQLFHHAAWPVTHSARDSIAHLAKLKPTSPPAPPQPSLAHQEQSPAPSHSPETDRQQISPAHQHSEAEPPGSPSSQNSTTASHSGSIDQSRQQL